MHEAGAKEVAAAFTRTAHHRNVSIIILVQNFFNKNLREITLNCQYLCLMKNPRDNSFINYIGRQMNGGQNNKILQEAYKKCCEEKYGHVFIDNSQHQENDLRIRSNIFPKKAIVYVSD